METSLFNEASLGLRDRILATPLADRFDLDTAHNTLYIDFSGLAINSAAQIDAIERDVEARLGSLHTRVAAVVNYDHFSIAPELVAPYAAMVNRLTARYYSRVTRYGTGGFLKARLATPAPAHH